MGGEAVWYDVGDVYLDGIRRAINKDLGGLDEFCSVRRLQAFYRRTNINITHQ